jgi:ribose/xylose/arabinose/galactoside ABC-type transport system permease subunit
VSTTPPPPVAEVATQAGLERAARVKVERVPLSLRAVLVNRQAGMTVVAMAIFVYFAATAPHFLNTNNLIEIGREMSFVAIAGVGMTYLFIVAEFDLSIGSIFSLTGVVFGWLIVNHGWSPWLAAVMALAFAALVGLINGGVTTMFNVPSLVVTLGMFSLAAGVALVITGEFPISLTNEPNSGLYSLIGGTVGSASNGVPAGIFWMLGIGIVGAFVLRKTRFGYNVFAVGGNARAARAMGIRTGRVKTACFVIAALLSGFAAIAQVAWLRNANPIAGVNFLFEVMGAVILGGIAVTGGEGSVYGTFVGAFILAVLLDGLVLRGVSGDYNTVFEGAIIIAAGILDVTVRRHGGVRNTALARTLVRVVPARMRSSPNDRMSSNDDTS